MKTQQLLNYERDRWIAGTDGLSELASAIDGSPVAIAGSGGLDFGGMLRHAREVGGPGLRKMTFHERARMIKGLGLAIMARKEELSELSYQTGATRKDGWIDIEGGAGTLFSFSSKGRRELPDAHVLLDGALEPLSKSGSFVGQHIYTSLQGAAVHINAFNFPVWGMLEKLAPTLLAGVPAIVKPASATSYLTEAAFRVMIDSGLLPTGAASGPRTEALRLSCSAMNLTLSRITTGWVRSLSAVAAEPVKPTTSWPVRWSNKSPTPPTISCNEPGGSRPLSTMIRTAASHR